MTVDESQARNKGTRVYWRGDAADSGIVTETNWDEFVLISYQADENAAGGRQS
jgi:hypothetical protein